MAALPFPSNRGCVSFYSRHFAFSILPDLLFRLDGPVCRLSPTFLLSCASYFAPCLVQVFLLILLSIFPFRNGFIACAPWQLTRTLVVRATKGGEQPRPKVIAVLGPMPSQSKIDTGAQGSERNKPNNKQKCVHQELPRLLREELRSLPIGLQYLPIPRHPPRRPLRLWGPQRSRRGLRSNQNIYPGSMSG